MLKECGLDGVVHPSQSLDAMYGWLSLCPVRSILYGTKTAPRDSLRATLSLSLSGRVKWTPVFQTFILLENSIIVKIGA
jgi:hypothetical protein